MIQERHLFVSGNVQGVGFRAAVKKCALIYGIKGFAKNLPDGRVEICAQGEADQIEAFSHSIRTQPGLGSISSIESKSGSLEPVYSDFKIL
jgi:acylphosphatase